MSDSRAYTYRISPNGSGSGENNAVHQTSPSWVLTFVRWDNRDTKRINSVDSTAVRDPMVVQNDCIQVSTSNSKGVLTPSINATLVMSDTNYETAVAPGDFLLVNMLNWQDDANRIAKAAKSRQPINGPKDGFKGLFKVQSVRRVVATLDPETGTKIVLFKISGFAFTEFNNTIYFNPYLIDSNVSRDNQLLFASYLGRDWSSITSAKGLTNVQDLIGTLISAFIGSGITDAGRHLVKGQLSSPNVHFYMPSMIGDLLGVTGAKAAKDVYTCIFGIQKYGSGSAVSLATGMNPSGLSHKYGRVWYTPTACQGDSFLKPEYWNQVKAWAIINQYTNAPLNEIYTTFRISPNNKVMPTVVFRQIPFTTEDYPGHSGVTKFLSLPRWKIDTTLIYDMDIGRDESARINFVQYFGRSTVSDTGYDIAEEIAKGNYVYDVKDVQRSGLRPYIVTTQFDEPTTVNKEWRSPTWARVVGDALIGGHMKMNGRITTVGIVDPISVGDNLELDDIVYHIEQIAHSCSINPQSGKRTFRTTVSLSSGVSITSSSSGTRYGEMDHTSAYDLRKADKNEIYPGISESQDTISRKSVDEIPAPSKPFAQPAGQKPFSDSSSRSGSTPKRFPRGSK